MGLGLLGRGLNNVKFLAECGAELIVTDLKNKRELKSSLDELKEYKNIKYTLGKHKLTDFRNRDFILKAAGVPLDSTYIKEAKKHKVPVEMDASLLISLIRRNCGRNYVTFVGVTGTKGKSMVTDLIYKFLKKAGKRAHLGGNVVGLATLPLLKKIKKGDIVVMELDSWQLQGFGDAKISPQIAVFTNLMPDHMNYYKGSMNRYFRDKAHIFEFQEKNNHLITSSKIVRLSKEKGINKKAKTKIYKKILSKGDNSHLIGAHLEENVSAAVEAVRVLGVSKKNTNLVLKNYKGVPGRLELVRKYKGVSYYNDTTATMPEAAINALKSFPKGKTILLAGGADKKLNLKEFTIEIKKHTKKVILFEGEATQKMLRNLPKKTLVVSSMKKAFVEVKKSAEKGDTVLLSPGAASFGIFTNEFDRGQQFVKLAKLNK